MEKKIGEIFDYKGVKLQCVRDDNSMGCEYCYLFDTNDCCNYKCLAHTRQDKTSVIFMNAKYTKL